jgi:multidrug efflux pump subunit AcrB
MSNKTTKTFGLTNASVSNRITVMLVTFIIVLAGVISYNSMPKEAFPEIVMPEIYVSTPYPGNSPSDIEKLITRPLEKELKSITGVDEITSTSVQGFSSVRILFDFSVPVDVALRKVKDKVDITKADPDFPKDLPADPNIFEMNFSEMVPIMNINLSGEFSMEQLKEYAEYLEDKIEDVPEINKVDIRGMMDKEVRIHVDMPKMEAVKLGFNDIAQAIQQENVTISGGELLVDDFRRTVSVKGEFQSISDIEDVIVKQEDNNIVYLRDIATVSFEEEEKQSYAREYGQPVVMLDVIKRGGTNLLQASATIQEIIAEAQEHYLPDNLEISITGDQSDQTQTQLDELVNSIIFGVILVVLVLLFFLGLRNALFVGVAIPLSMLLSFFILNVMGVTLNTMVLFSLVLALGMLVDNGIVVVENIYRLMDEGKKPIEAAKEGVGEVAWPIIASTATTLAAFIPLAIWPGIMGEFMKYLPITLIIVLSSSLFVALVINPVLTAMYMKLKENEFEMSSKARTRIIVLFIASILLSAMALDGGGFMTFLSFIPFLLGMFIVLSRFLFVTGKVGIAQLWRPSLILLISLILFYVMGDILKGNLTLIILVFLYVYRFALAPASDYFQNVIMVKLENFYERFLRNILAGRKPVRLVIGMFALLLFSFVVVGVFAPQVLFFPENEPQYLNVYIETPIGTDIEKTNELTKHIETLVLKDLDLPASVDGEPLVYKGKEIKKSDIVSSVIAQVGSGTSDPAQGPSFGDTPHKGRIQISFLKFADRMGIGTNDVLEEMRKSIEDIPGVRITVTKNADGPPQGAAVNIELAGEDYEQLLAEGDALRQYINDAFIPGIEELKLDVETGKPELPIVIDRDKARRLNVSTSQIGDAMRTALFGKEISSYKEGEDDYPIMLRFSREYAYDADALMDQRITFRNQSNGRIVQIPLSAVAHKEKSSTFSAVKRIDLDRVVTLYSNVTTEYNPTEVVGKIKEILVGYEMPEGVTFKFTGQQEEQAKEMGFLTNALLIAVFMILLIIIAQFNSATTPLIIMTSVVLSLIGVLLGLVIFQMDFIIIMTMIGIISLAGVVVNNAIVLIDYTKLLEARKKEKLGLDEEVMLGKNDMFEAVVEAGKKRLRPVLLTAITTVLGLVPLAVGLNIDFIGLMTKLDPGIYVGGDNVVFWGPMSWTIIFGLTFATFLTLVIVPAMYLLLSKVTRRLTSV